jgi:hypothetical protein
MKALASSGMVVGHTSLEAYGLERQVLPLILAFSDRKATIRIREAPDISSRVTGFCRDSQEL